MDIWWRTFATRARKYFAHVSPIEFYPVFHRRIQIVWNELRRALREGGEKQSGKTSTAPRATSISISAIVLYFDGFESKPNQLRYGRSSGATRSRFLRETRSPISPISFICECLRLETLPFPERWKRGGRRRRGTETWPLNYRPRGIRRTFAVNSISTLVRTRETFPRHLPSLPTVSSYFWRTATSRTACKYIFTRGPAELS